MNCLKSIAIDGPAGAGKSTIARLVAERLNFIYVDSGALYRTVALAVKQKGILVVPVQLQQMFSEIQIEMCYIDGLQHMFLDGVDVSDRIRSSEISQLTSQIAQLKVVREYLFSCQQKMAQEHDVVMDGRDIGTEILPNANVKIFLTATAQERAQRRYKQLLESKTIKTLEEVLQEVKQRDENDYNRAVSPLRQAEDAILVDTSDMTLEESVDFILDVISKKLA